MILKPKLILAAAIMILAFSFWLTWSAGFSGSVGQLLQGIAASLIVMALLKEKITRLAVFIVKGFLISFVATFIIWIVIRGIVVAFYSVYFGPWLTISSLVYLILPQALLPVAISIVVYGVTRTKLKPWEILLSTWYLSIFVVFAAYDVWWLLFVKPHVEHFYSSGAGAIALDMLLVFLALLIACAFTVIYWIVREPNPTSTTPTTMPS